MPPPTLAHPRPPKPPPWPQLGPRLNLIKKVGVIDERSLKKSKKHHARASGESASTVNYS